MERELGTSQVSMTIRHREAFSLLNHIINASFFVCMSCKSLVSGAKAPPEVHFIVTILSDWSILSAMGDRCWPSQEQGGSNRTLPCSAIEPEGHCCLPKPLGAALLTRGFRPTRGMQLPSPFRTVKSRGDQDKNYKEHYCTEDHPWLGEILSRCLPRHSFGFLSTPANGCTVYTSPDKASDDVH